MSIAQTAVRDDGTLHDRFVDTFWDDAKAFAKFSEYVWPKGFACRRCGCNRGTYLPNRDVIVCRDCRMHHSLIAGTPLHGAKKPIKLWFAAIFIAGTGGDRRDIARRLGIHPQTAAKWVRRLNRSVSGKDLIRKFWDDLRPC